MQQRRWLRVRETSVLQRMHRTGHAMHLLRSVATEEDALDRGSYVLRSLLSGRSRALFS